MLKNGITASDEEIEELAEEMAKSITLWDIIVCEIKSKILVLYCKILIILHFY